jgi:hypothetical protein
MDLEGLACWSFKALEMSEGAFGCCKYFYFIFCFCLNIQEHVI